MTSFLLFCAAIVACIGIARYFESNKWFWSAFTAFTLAFAMGAIVNSADKKESKKQLTEQVRPTQALAPSLGSLIYLLASDELPAPKKATSNPVSQANVPADSEQSLTLSDVPGVTKGIYLHALPNPPNSVGIIDDS